MLCRTKIKLAFEICSSLKNWEEEKPEFAKKSISSEMCCACTKFKINYVCSSLYVAHWGEVIYKLSCLYAMINEKVVPHDGVAWSLDHLQYIQNYQVFGSNEILKNGFKSRFLKQLQSKRFKDSKWHPYLLM